MSGHFLWAHAPVVPLKKETKFQRLIGKVNYLVNWKERDSFWDFYSIFRKKKMKLRHPPLRFERPDETLVWLKYSRNETISLNLNRPHMLFWDHNGSRCNKMFSTNFLLMLEHMNKWNFTNLRISIALESKE